MTTSPPQLRLRHPLMSTFKVGLLLLLPAGLGLCYVPFHARAELNSGVHQLQNGRPAYDVQADIDYQLLTLKARANVTIPATAADPLNDAAFFLFANASGVGGDDDRRKNLVVDGVSFQGHPVPFTFKGAVLRASLPAPQGAPFALQISWHGIVPRSPAGSSDDLMGAMGGDISSLLGMGGQKADKPKNTDYGLYTYGNGILSLGSFWYPQLAVREHGTWAAAQPEGLGDVAYAEKSDYTVNFSGLPAGVTVVGPGIESMEGGIRHFEAADMREFAVLMSEDFVERHQDVPLGNGTVRVSSITTRAHVAKSAQALDIASHALQIYSRRFGNYPYPEFKVVEAPMRGGAGGMEYSSMVGVASMLYGDMKAQLGGMMTSLDLPGASDLLKGFEDDAGQTPAKAPAATKKPATTEGGNPLTDMVSGALSEQMGMLDSLFEETIAHEAGHQWWAIGVGSDSIRHPFLDESLTNWSSMLYFEDRYGKATAAKMTDLHLKTNFSMGAALGGGDMPANLPTSAYKNNLQYGAVIYGKGALFYGELRNLVGDAAYFAALRHYFAQYNDRLAGPNSLHALMVAAAPDKRAAIDALYTHWIDEAHGQQDIGGGALGNVLGALDLNNILGSLMGAAGNGTGGGILGGGDE